MPKQNPNKSSETDSNKSSLKVRASARTKKNTTNPTSPIKKNTEKPSKKKINVKSNEKNELNDDHYLCVSDSSIHDPVESVCSLSAKEACKKSTQSDSNPTASNQQPKSSISITKIPEENDFVLVFWSLEKNFSIQSVLCVHPKNGEQIKVGEEYEISFGNNIFLGVLKFIGAKQKCNDLLKTVTNSEKDNFSLPSQKKTVNSSQTNSKTNDLKTNKQQEIEILQYKKKLLDLHQQLETEKNSNNELKKELRDLKETIVQHQQTFTKEEIGRILTMCKIFDNLYSSKPNVYIPTLIPFSSEFPNFMIPADQETKIKEIIKNTVHDTGCKSFREIIPLVMVEGSEFLTKTASVIIKDYKQVLNPIEELLRRQDTSFTTNKRNLSLNSFIQDFRKNHRRNASRSDSTGEMSTEACADNFDLRESEFN